MNRGMEMSFLSRIFDQEELSFRRRILRHLV